MNRRTTPKLILGSLTIAIVLLMNPGNAFAGGVSIPTCTPGSDPDGAGPLTQTPDAQLVTGTPVAGGMEAAGGSFAYQFIGDPDGAGPVLPMLQFTEVWTTSARSYIVICGLDPTVEYHIKKIITNNTPFDVWNNFDNELLDRSGQPNDLSDKASWPYVTVLGGGFTHSNDGDGLSFAMGTLDVLRTSTEYSSVFADEDGFVDFLNYFNGPMNPGEQDNPMSYALRDRSGVTTASEQPFILTQAPNFQTECPPGTIGTPPRCEPTMVGGNFEGVDTTALLVAGAQMNAAWLIPLVLGIIGIGIVVAKKFRN